MVRSFPATNGSRSNQGRSHPRRQKRKQAANYPTPTPPIVPCGRLSKDEARKPDYSCQPVQRRHRGRALIVGGFRLALILSKIVAVRRRRRGWRFLTIFANALWGRWWKAACRATRQPSVLGSASPAPCARWRASKPRAILLAPTGGDHRSGRIEAHRDYLLGLIRRRPDMTLLEIQERLIAIAASVSRPPRSCAFSIAMDSRLKKSAHAEEQQRSDVLSERRDWFAGQLDLDPFASCSSTRLGFDDMARKRGRCRRGQRLRAAIPHGHYKTVTLVAGLRLCGLVAQRPSIGRSTPPRSRMGGKRPSPHSRRRHRRHGHLSSHKGPGSSLIRRPSRLRYLPPYSPT